MNLAVFIAAASMSAIVGSSTGIGGGVILLIFLAYVANPIAIVPIHGCVQAFSCLTRLVVLLYILVAYLPLVYTFYHKMA